MCTGVVDGVELTVDVEESDLLPLHLDQLAVVRFKLACATLTYSAMLASSISQLSCGVLSCQDGEDSGRPRCPGCGEI